MITAEQFTRYQTSFVTSIRKLKSGCLHYNISADKAITLLGTKTFTITIGLATYLFYDCAERSYIGYRTLIHITPQASIGLVKSVKMILVSVHQSSPVIVDGHTYCMHEIYTCI